MNLIDKAIGVFSPGAALKREVSRAKLNMLERTFQNTGYSDGGASTRKKSLKGWKSWSASPEEDIDLNLFTLRNRAMDLYMNSTIGNGAIKSARTNVVGSGLHLKARIDKKFLGLSDDEADMWEQNAEREFMIWASSVHSDALKLNNFFEQQQLAFLAQLQKGDVFAVLKQDKPKSYMPCGLRVHLIEGDRVTTPNTLANVIAEGIFAVEGIAKNGNRVISGVEIDKSGAVVAYYICNRYPQSFYIRNTQAPLKWTRVEAFGKRTGRPNILHLMESERPEQRRGVPFLAPVIEPLKQMTRYTEAELMAAVVTGMFTVFVKTEGPASENVFADMIPTEDQEGIQTDPPDYQLGNGAINILQEGESIDIANPGRPNQAFEGFVNALAKQIGSALEIPQEMLFKAFNSSYSAARAALLEAWKMFKMRRTWLANDFCQPIYEEWLAQNIALGRIKAPHFFDDISFRQAWCKAEWTGPAPGQLDPVKEANGAKIRVEQGFSTRERESLEINGSDFDKNIEQAKREQALMKEVGLSAETKK